MQAYSGAGKGGGGDTLDRDSTVDSGIVSTLDRDSRAIGTTTTVVHDSTTPTLGHDSRAAASVMRVTPSLDYDSTADRAATSVMHDDSATLVSEKTTSDLENADAALAPDGGNDVFADRAATSDMNDNSAMLVSESTASDLENADAALAPNGGNDVLADIAATSIMHDDSATLVSESITSVVENADAALSPDGGNDAYGKNPNCLMLLASVCQADGDMLRFKHKDVTNSTMKLAVGATFLSASQAEKLVAQFCFENSRGYVKRASKARWCRFQCFFSDCPFTVVLSPAHSKDQAVHDKLKGDMHQLLVIRNAILVHECDSVFFLQPSSVQQAMVNKLERKRSYLSVS